MLVEQLKPGGNAFESLLTSDIVDEYSAVRIPDVVRNQTLEFFLAGGIPELETIECALVDDILHEKVDADGLLDVERCTFLLRSKLL